MKGSPVYDSLQAQIGLWLLTTQVANVPQELGHGSMHFWLTQARSWGHSEFRTHSGRHIGGVPVYSGRQEQTAWPFTTRHWLLGPQDEGLHGSLYFVSSSTRFKFRTMRNISVFFEIFLIKIYVKCKKDESLFVPISRINAQCWKGFPL